MSEYHAAVGLAALDGWVADRSLFQRVAVAYRSGLAGDGLAQLQHGYGVGWIAATCNVRFRGARADRVAGVLAREGIDSRRWWGDGLHGQPAFAAFRRGDLRATDLLAQETLGLPCFPDLSDAEVRRICRTIADAFGTTGMEPRRFESAAS